MAATAPQLRSTKPEVIDFDSLVLGPCMTVFGEPIRYRTVALPGEPAVTALITGVFDEPNISQFGIDGFNPGNVVNTKPLLGVQISQLAAFGITPTQDDVLTRVSTGNTYQVAMVRQDSHGGASLELNNAFDTVDPP